MMQARPFASLSSGLLARKGAAKPAMRPQGFGHIGSAVEDLGWNDMGTADVAREQPVAELVPSPVAALTPMQAFEPAPPVVEQQRAAIVASFATPVEQRGAASAKAPAAVPRAKPKAKAAFTLRLEAERHLKLRLACAVTGRSAQQLLTEALDQLLESRPDVAALAEQVPVKARKPS